MDQTAQTLFEYLRDVLYAPDTAALDVAALPPQWRMLGEGLQVLGGYVREQRAFLLALSRGDLSAPPPSVDNMLAAPAKQLQGALRHLAWQTQQVAKGDYSQRVDFMGEFSDSFNAMVDQLRERTAGLVAEKERVERKNQELSRNLELVISLTDHTHNMIFAFSSDTGQQIFRNQSAQWFERASPRAYLLLREKLIHHAPALDRGSELWETAVELQDSAVRASYQVESFPLAWGTETAAIHIVTDGTERKKREDLTWSLAYVDPLTGLNNRRWAMDHMEELFGAGRPFLLSFVDLDYLKYCNDNFGHSSGDHYLTEVAHILQTLGGDLCRTGGDEFILLQEGSDSDEQDRRLEKLRTLLQEQSDAPYPKSFSFATVAVPAKASRPVDAYLQEADRRMYCYKRAHRRPLFQAANWSDDR